MLALFGISAQRRAEVRVSAIGRGERPVGILPEHEAQFEANAGKVMKNVPSILRAANHGGTTDLHKYMSRSSTIRCR